MNTLTLLREERNVSSPKKGNHMPLDTIVAEYVAFLPRNALTESNHVRLSDKPKFRDIQLI